ncbi:MAG: tRNA modification GTPase [Planctomycetota bacterium]
MNDTIVAVSSPTSDGRVILRISGPGTVDVLRRILRPCTWGQQCGLVKGTVAVDAELSVDADLYFFSGPRSYTGQDVAEVHINTNRSVTQALLGMILGTKAVPVRMAGPGEFTARAYLNGRMDLTQAEAVNEVVVSSNRYQLAAAENLLAGRLGGTAAAARAEIMECLSLIEAGLDFSEEDIEFITRPEALERLGRVKERLQELLSGSITYEYSRRSKCRQKQPAQLLFGPAPQHSFREAQDNQRCADRNPGLRALPMRIV